MEFWGVAEGGSKGMRPDAVAVVRGEGQKSTKDA